jgi:hypothetical protein
MERKRKDEYQRVTDVGSWKKRRVAKCRCDVSMELPTRG